MAAAPEGCDAVPHAASVYSLGPRRARAIRATNVAGTRNVLGAAAEPGLAPIVHVSSFVALLPTAGTLRVGAPVGSPAGAYAASKSASERVARELAAGGRRSRSRTRAP